MSTQYMLAACNVVRFEDRASDKANISKMYNQMTNIFRLQPTKQHIRHSTTTGQRARELARIPVGVPELPANTVGRPEVITMLKSHLLKSRNSENKVLAFGGGGVGE